MSQGTTQKMLTLVPPNKLSPDLPLLAQSGLSTYIYIIIINNNSNNIIYICIILYYIYYNIIYIIILYIYIIL